eukprot:3826284-Pyramimonas_sp.AAC.1
MLRSSTRYESLPHSRHTPRPAGGKPSRREGSVLLELAPGATLRVAGLGRRTSIGLGRTVVPGRKKDGRLGGDRQIR